MPKPLLIIINGPPGSGKTMLAKRLSTDLQVPVVHRDDIAETLFDALKCQMHGRPALIGPASFQLMHYFAGLLLAVGQSLIIEGCFYSTELATIEFLQLKQVYDFEPFQIQCKENSSVLLDRFLTRAGTQERHIYHRDLEFAENNREVFLRERFADLALGGQRIEIDTTDVFAYDYTGLLQEIRAALVAMHRRETSSL